jgi:hypothetical protein
VEAALSKCFSKPFREHTVVIYHKEDRPLIIASRRIVFDSIKEMVHLDFLAAVYRA